MEAIPFLSEPFRLRGASGEMNAAGPLSLCGLRGPGEEIIGSFYDIDRNFIVVLERLSGRGFEGPHAPVTIVRSGQPIGFKVEPALVDDAEEPVPPVEAVDRKSTRLNSSHPVSSRMPSSA